MVATMSTLSESSENAETLNEKDAPNEQLNNLSEPAQRDWNSLFCALGFAVLAISCWTLTCLSNYRPVYGTCHSYTSDCFDHTSFTRDHPNRVRALYHNEQFLRAVRIVSTILAVSVLPLTVLICGRAAVASRRNPRPSLRQVLARADAGKFDLYPRYAQQKLYSPAVVLGSLLAIIGALLYPLQEVFVTWQTIQAPSGAFQYSRDGTVFDLARADVDFQQHLVSLPKAVQDQAIVNYVWSIQDDELASTGFQIDDPPYERTGSSFYPPFSDPIFETDREPTISVLWTSVQPNGTHTGLLSNYSMGLKTTVSCVKEPLPPSPRACSGSQGFSTHYHADSALDDAPGTWIDVRTCVPGNPTAFPWRLDMGFAPQELSEELYIDYNFGSGWAYGSDPSFITNSTTHCTAKTALAYFELPNYANNGVPGSLSAKLDIEPPNNTTVYEWSGFGSTWLREYDQNDSKGGLSINASILNGWSMSDPYNTAASEQPLPGTVQVLQAYHGPLLSTALIMFLNATVLQQIPNYYPPVRVIPLFDYLRQCITTAYGDPFSEWLALLADPETATCIFNITSTLADISALLALGPLYDGVAQDDPRAMQSMTILADQGYPAQKLHVPLWFIIFESILLAIYLVSILTLAIVSTRDLKWTKRLDGLAFFMLGSMYANRLPPFRSKTDLEDSSILDSLPGYVDVRSRKER